MSALEPKEEECVFDRIVKVINWCSDVWIVVSLVIMFVSIALDVVTREFFNSPLTWHLEVSQYMLINVTYVGAAVAHRHGQHISINSLVTRLPKMGQMYMDLFGKLILLPFLLLLVYSAYTLLFETKGLTPVLRLPMWTYYSPMFIGSVLLCLHSILASVKDIRAIVTA